MRDGSVVLVEIARGTVTRVAGDGTVAVVAHTGGGPNGLAVGPDGAFYSATTAASSGALEGLLRPTMQAVRLCGRPDRARRSANAARCGVSTIAAARIRLRGPNDIVFDGQGGFYFTDLGKTRARDRDHGGVYYARPTARGSSRSPIRC